jgi:prepilin-type N-terminal cleavage/methylation domain-containing protein
MVSLNKKGFTLIELLVVISIIGMLSSVTLASLNDARAKTRDTAKIRSIKEIQTALQIYFNEKGTYPNSNSSPYGLEKLITEKYISRIETGIIYRPIKVTNYFCWDPGVCPNYFLGSSLEKRNNPILNNDSDYVGLTQTAIEATNYPGHRVYGKSDNCTTNEDKSSSPELCYDIKQ